MSLAELVRQPEQSDRAKQHTASDPVRSSFRSATFGQKLIKG
jgi:hypothetical protein